MSAKKSNKDASSKYKKQKKSQANKNLIWKIIALVVILLFLLFMIRPQLGGDKNNPAHSQGKSPVFKKEGILSFIKQENQEAVKIDIEITDNYFEQTRGMMFRTSLPENAGMLFIMEREEPQSFWMKNTYVSLDIIYVDSKFNIVTIQKYTQPRSEEPIPSIRKAKYVIEVNAGFCDRFNIKEGDRVSFKRI